jgi:hypothetical protein
LTDGVFFERVFKPEGPGLVSERKQLNLIFEFLFIGFSIAGVGDF